ncbi:MAG: hypothetical protein AAF658_00350, partial [Myxococcota bacterium]
MMLSLAAMEPIPIANDALFVVRVNKDESTLLANLSHNHAIRAKRFEVFAELDRESGACTFRVIVPVKSL